MVSLPDQIDLAHAMAIADAELDLRKARAVSNGLLASLPGAEELFDKWRHTDHLFERLRRRGPAAQADRAICPQAAGEAGQASAKLATVATHRKFCGKVKCAERTQF
jgi:hypothetical protein